MGSANKMKTRVSMVQIHLPAHYAGIAQLAEQ